jgi:hypothetical protein
VLTTDENTADFSLPPDKLYHVYPIICNEQLIIVSKPTILNTIIGISKVSFTENNSEAVITGNLHSTVKNVIAKVSNTAFPTTLNSEGDKLTISKDDFISKNGLHIKLKMNTDSYITLFTENEIDGIKAFSSAVKLSSIITLKEKVVVRYVINTPISDKKQFNIKIEFQSDAPDTIPELTLVKGSPKPLTIADGQLIDRTPVLTLKKGLFGGKYSASITIKAEPTSMNTKFALFVSGDNKNISFNQNSNIGIKDLRLRHQCFCEESSLL